MAVWFFVLVAMSDSPYLKGRLGAKMATELFTNYPLSPWGYMATSPGERLDDEVIRRLGMIESRLSRIEELLSKSHVKE